MLTSPYACLFVQTRRICEFIFEVALQFMLNLVVPLSLSFNFFFLSLVFFFLWVHPTASCPCLSSYFACFSNTCQMHAFTLLSESQLYDVDFFWREVAHCSLSSRWLSVISGVVVGANYVLSMRSHLNA